MASLNKIGKHKTSIYRGIVRVHGCLDYMGEGVAVTYYSTVVVSANAKYIILNTGGWYTVTTKRRMNQASREFNLGYSVYQKKGVWYVDYKNLTYEFKNDTIILTRDIYET